MTCYHKRLTPYFLYNTDSFETSKSQPYKELYKEVLWLNQNQPPRSWCLKMIQSDWFERASMIVIIVNCITLGMYRERLQCDFYKLVSNENSDCRYSLFTSRIALPKTPKPVGALVMLRVGRLRAKTS